MPALGKTIVVALPVVDPRSTWCERILDRVLEKAQALDITFDPEERLALEVRVFLTGHALSHSDVDNLLVAVMNGLQGQIGGQGKKIMHPGRRVIRNDRQVWRAQIEKAERPAGVVAEVGGHLTITCL